MGRLPALLLAAFLLVACARTVPPPAETAPPPRAEPPAQAAEPGASGASRAQSEREQRAGPGWHHLLSGPDTLHYANETAAYLGAQCGPPYYRVTLSPTPTVEPVQRLPVAEGQVPSPDGRRLAWYDQGRIFVRDLPSGQERALTSPPQPAPPNLIKHTGWDWAGHPLWSLDSQWLYFRSNRLDSRRSVFWRVPADGSGPEEAMPEGMSYIGEHGANQERILRPVESSVLEAILKPEPDSPGLYENLLADLSLSPDGRYALHENRKGSEIYDLERPAQPVVSAAVPDGQNASGNAAFKTSVWSPDGRRVLMQVRLQGADLSQVIGILENRPSATMTFYGLDDPGMGLLQPLGWFGPDHLLVRMSPWDELYNWPDKQSEPEIWLLDLRQARPPRESTSPRLLAARVSSALWDRNALTVREHRVVSDGQVSLRLDRPVPARWIAEQVQVDGPGARLIASGGTAGVVTMAFAKGHRSPTLRSFYPPDHAVSLSPDRRQAVFRLAADRQTAHYYLADTTTGAVTRLDLPDRGGPLLWSPDGRYLLLGTQLVDWAAGKLLHTLPDKASALFSPDGSQVLYARAAWGEVELLTMATGQAQRLGRGLVVGWDARGRPLWIEWELAQHRVRVESYGL